jgi:hypothetical protein
LREQEQILNQFSSLFDGEGKADAFTQRWYWYDLIFKLAGESIIDMTKIEGMPIKQIFTHLAYSSDKYASEKNTQV